LHVAQATGEEVGIVKGKHSADHVPFAVTFERVVFESEQDDLHLAQNEFEGVSGGRAIVSNRNRLSRPFSIGGAEKQLRTLWRMIKTSTGDSSLAKKNGSRMSSFTLFRWSQRACYVNA
jgi:hypothetical protein